MPNKIGWCDETWNPVTGCTKVSRGCRRCYAETLARRFWGDRPFAEVRTHPDRLAIPLRWRKPRRVFVNSMSDLFHEDVPDEFILQVWEVMGVSQDHTFQILTKRPERMRSIVSRIGSSPDGYVAFERGHAIPLPNVWLGVSVEDQATADERIPILAKTPAAVRFVSYEPALGPVDLLWPETTYPDGPPMCCSGRDCGCKGLPADPPLLYGIQWVIAGGESGPGARPAHPDWFRAVRDACERWGTAFFLKQWGEWAPNCLCDRPRPCTTTQRPDPGKPGVMFRCGKKAAGRELDGRTWDGFPGSGR